MTDSSPSWEELVEEGYRLMEAVPLDRFALGDIIVQAVAAWVSANHPDVGMTTEMTELALFDIAMSLSITRGATSEMWYTCRAWTPEQRLPGVSFHRHQKARGHPHRVELLLHDENMEDLLKRAFRAEELFRDKNVRALLDERSRGRRTAIKRMTAAFETEEFLERKREAKLEEEQVRAFRLQGKEGERFTDACTMLSRITTDLVGLMDVLDLCPVLLRDPLRERLEHINKATEQMLDAMLPPEQRSPQAQPPFIDVEGTIAADGTSQEHRRAALPEGREPI